MQGFPYKRVLLGVSGGIAAYKSALIVRLLKKQQIDVRVVMTHGAQAFISSMTLQALSGHPVHCELFDEATEAAMGHIELAKWADLILIAPATANVMAKLAHGMADDLLSTLCLATDAPIAIAPAMNQAMWRSSQTQANATTLSDIGVALLGPGQGEQACGDTGPGRMLEPKEIISLLQESQPKSLAKPLNKQHIVITAGPTQEAIDPVRFLSNPSSGKMGFALAEAAAQAGAQVTLIAGPVSLDTPKGVSQRINVKTALDMHKHACNTPCDIFIACAAVADYRPKQQANQKIKKHQQDGMTLELVRNPDILADVAKLSPKPFCVGFAAETQALADNAQSKLIKKSLNMIIANDVSQQEIGFASNNNKVTVFWQDNKDTQQQAFDTMSKSTLAKKLIALITSIYLPNEE